MNHFIRVNSINNNIFNGDFRNYGIVKVIKINKCILCHKSAKNICKIKTITILTKDFQQKRVCGVKGRFKWITDKLEIFTYICGDTK